MDFLPDARLPNKNRVGHAQIIVQYARLKLDLPIEAVLFVEFLC